MRKTLMFMLVTAILLLISQTVFSQELTRGDKVWLIMGFEIQKDKMRLEERLKDIDLRIAKNEQTIRETNQLLANIQKAKLSGDEKQRFNAIQAEPLANQALSRAKETQRNLQKQRIELKMAIQQLEEVERRLNDSYSKIKSMKNVSGFIKECLGSVKIINSKGQESSCSNYSLVEEGSMIKTGSDGEAKLHILGGRGFMELEPNTEVSFLKVTPKQDIIEFVKGKARFVIEKLENFKKKVEELVKSYKEYKADTEGGELSIWACKEKLVPGETCVMKVPWAVIGPRGTVFTMDRQDDEIKVDVSEGIVEVEVNLSSGKKIVEVKEGSMVVIKPDGTLNLVKKEVKRNE